MASFTWKISFALLLLLSVMSFNGSICSGSSGIRCHQNDRRLLQIFRDGVKDSSDVLPSWSAEQDCCAWEGVHCDNITARVTNLDLRSQYLQGEINLSLLQLEFLSYLDLSYNDFETLRSPSTHSQRYHNKSFATSELHANFSSSLIYLDFSYSYNLHMDNLHWLSLVPSLKYLNLTEIDLHSETNWLQSMAMLPSLLELRLSQCRLTKISPSLKYVNFTSLVTLDLSYNHDLQIDNFHWLSLAPSLKYLDLSAIDLHNQTNWLQSLAMLPSLSELRLVDCKLYNIGPSLKYVNFTSLVTLDLFYNDGLQIDNFHWPSLAPSLKYLDLSGIDLHNQTNWLQSIAMLPSLFELRLSQCRLTNISPSLKYVNFTSLVTLDLSSNYDLQIDSFNWLSLASSLKYLDLSGIDLHNHTNWLQSIAMLPSLSELRLVGCELNNFSPSYVNFTSLVTLDLSDNNLSGSIPNWISQFEHLQHLNLSRNLLSGLIPSSFGNLSSLVVLNIRSNNLSGNIPESLGQLSKLESLLVGGNPFKGFLSETYFKALGNLKELDLRHTGITLDLGPNWVPPFQLRSLNLRSLILGPNFPPWIYTQISLENLDISSTGISSFDENVFWNFVGEIKQTLNMSNNSISGDISKILLNADYINLAWNNFKGALPRITKNVGWLDLSHNKFTGSVSSLLCHPVNKEIKNLYFLELSNNLLIGELPDCWTNWENLEFIFLGNNNLTGELSPSLGSLLHLYAIDLHNNSFFGEIPSSLQNCKDLEFINFERNKLSGSIPTWMQQSILFLQLRSNHFVGIIPSQACQLPYLYVLDIADNGLSGSIPECLYNITAMNTDDYYGLVEIGTGDGDDYPYRVMLYVKGNELEYGDSLKFIRSFDFSSNNLSGEIPQELFSLTWLVSLNLSHNHLMGKIPQNVQDMTQLESLDLSNNQLSGEVPEGISNLNFLGYLNLSYNDFSGQIPLGNHLTTFDNRSYMGNPQLCGAPLTKNCTKEENPVAEEHEESGTESWFYLGMGVGFALGFWGVCGAIFFIRTFRHAYFRLLDRVADRLDVVGALRFNIFRH